MYFTGSLAAQLDSTEEEHQLRQALQRRPKPSEHFVLSAQNYNAVLEGAIAELRCNSVDRPNLEICINFFTLTPPSRFNEEEAIDRLKKLCDATDATSYTNEHCWKRSLAAVVISTAKGSGEWLEKSLT